jgi:hypothetical protein
MGVEVLVGGGIGVALGVAAGPASPATAVQETSASSRGEASNESPFLVIEYPSLQMLHE